MHMNETEFYQATKNRSLKGAYLLCGEEELTKQEAAVRVEELLDPGFRELNRQSFTRPAAASEVFAACDQLPLFDSFRLVEVKEWDESVSRGLLEKDRLLFLPDTTVLLLLCRGACKKTDPLFKLLAQKNRVAVFEPLTRDRAVNMLLREAGLKNVGLSRSVAGLLADRVGYDAYRLRNEFSKAADFVGPRGEVTEAVLDSVVTPTAEFQVFELLETLLAGRRAQGLTMLRQALQQGENALGLAAFLCGRLKLILTAREHLEAGKTPEAAAKLLGGSPYAAKKAVQSAQKRTAAQWRQVLKAFELVDIQTKQGLAKDSDALLLAVISQF